jgi:hypothetical protein
MTCAERRKELQRQASTKEGLEQVRQEWGRVRPVGDGDPGPTSADVREMIETILQAEFKSGYTPPHD